METAEPKPSKDGNSTEMCSCLYSIIGLKKPPIDLRAPLNFTYIISKINEIHNALDGVVGEQRLKRMLKVAENVMKDKDEELRYRVHGTANDAWCKHNCSFYKGAAKTIRQYVNDYRKKKEDELERIRELYGPVPSASLNRGPNGGPCDNYVVKTNETMMIPVSNVDSQDGDTGPECEQTARADADEGTTSGSLGITSTSGTSLITDEPVLIEAAGDCGQVDESSVDVQEKIKTPSESPDSQQKKRVKTCEKVNLEKGANSFRDHQQPVRAADEETKDAIEDNESSLSKPMDGRFSAAISPISTMNPTGVLEPSSACQQGSIGMTLVECQSLGAISKGPGMTLTEDGAQVSNKDSELIMTPQQNHQEIPQKDGEKKETEPSLVESETCVSDVSKRAHPETPRSTGHSVSGTKLPTSIDFDEWSDEEGALQIVERPSSSESSIETDPAATTEKKSETDQLDLVLSSVDMGEEPPVHQIHSDDFEGINDVIEAISAAEILPPPRTMIDVLHDMTDDGCVASITDLEVGEVLKIADSSTGAETMLVQANDRIDRAAEENNEPMMVANVEESCFEVINISDTSDDEICPDNQLALVSRLIKSEPGDDCPMGVGADQFCGTEEPNQQQQPRGNSNLPACPAEAQRPQDPVTLSSWSSSPHSSRSGKTPPQLSSFAAKLDAMSAASQRSSRAAAGSWLTKRGRGGRGRGRGRGRNSRVSKHRAVLSKKPRGAKMSDLSHSQGGIGRFLIRLGPGSRPLGLPPLATDNRGFLTQPSKSSYMEAAPRLTRETLMRPLVAPHAIAGGSSSSSYNSPVPGTSNQDNLPANQLQQVQHLHQVSSPNPMVSDSDPRVRVVNMIMDHYHLGKKFVLFKVLWEGERRLITYESPGAVIMHEKPLKLYLKLLKMCSTRRHTYLIKKCREIGTPITGIY